MAIQIWAHRGASGYAPENTLEAFQVAIDQGADGIELDVHLTRDGQVVVAHDETIDRVSDGTGTIGEMTLEALRKFHFGKAFSQYASVRIPTLAEVLALLAPTGMTLNIELKTTHYEYPGIEQKCIDLVHAAGMTDRVWYSSFNHHSLLRVKAIDASLPCGILYDCTMVRPWDYAKAAGFDALHPHFSELRIPGEAADSHAAGIRIHAWTVNTQEHLALVAQTGIDALITNYPDRALVAVGRG